MDAPPASVLVGQPGGAIRQPTMKDQPNVKALRPLEAEFLSRNHLPDHGVVMFLNGLPFAWDSMPLPQNYAPGVIGLSRSLLFVRHEMPESAGKFSTWELTYLHE